MSLLHLNPQQQHDAHLPTVWCVCFVVFSSCVIASTNCFVFPLLCLSRSLAVCWLLIAPWLLFVFAFQCSFGHLPQWHPSHRVQLAMTLVVITITMMVPIWCSHDGEPVCMISCIRLTSYHRIVSHIINGVMPTTVVVPLVVLLLVITNGR